MKYPIYIEQDETLLNFLSTVPDLPGCTTTANSFNNAFDKTYEAIKAHLSILAEYGESIPNGKSIDHHRSVLKNDIDVIWAIVDIDITPYLGKSHKINVTLPELLISQIDDRVSKSTAYKTRSGFIASACLAELAK